MRLEGDGETYGFVASSKLHLGSALKLAPALLEASASHVASAVCYRAGAAGSVGTGGGVLAAQTAIAGIIPVDHVTGTAASDVIDRGSTAKITLEFLVEAEHCAFTGAVNIAGATTARGEGRRSARVKARQRSRACSGARIGRLGVLQADDISRSSTAGVDGGSTCMRHRRVRLNNAVI